MAEENKTAVLTLGTVERADGTAHTNLGTQLSDRFEYIRLYKDEERKELLATVLAPEGEKVDNIGTALTNFIYAMIDGAWGGSGQGPEGSAMFVADKVNTVQSSTKHNIRKLWLELIPHAGSRFATKGYLTDINTLVQSLQNKAAIAVRSEKLYGLMRSSTRERTPKEEKITVQI